MDEIKLIRWRETFEEEVKNIQVEFNSYFLNRTLDEIYNIRINESNEWELQIEDSIPNQIKTRLLQIFLDSKPEDSI